MLAVTHCGTQMWWKCCDGPSLRDGQVLDCCNRVVLAWKEETIYCWDIGDLVHLSRGLSSKSFFKWPQSLPLSLIWFQAKRKGRIVSEPYPKIHDPNNRSTWGIRDLGNLVPNFLQQCVRPQDLLPHVGSNFEFGVSLERGESPTPHRGWNDHVGHLWKGPNTDLTSRYVQFRKQWACQTTLSKRCLIVKGRGEIYQRTRFSWFMKSGS
jgi:hypothetical protein